ncbi:M-phase phospho 8 [Pelobates cultripes]|uniref:M-phase phospho 8 n=1 Tax=Pelobates cultripes TaxID=61616 RepID=A0AAD1VP57_PELCU|nr:M-phase phospho 8 [Pelobates cultripes]
MADTAERDGGTGGDSMETDTKESESAGTAAPEDGGGSRAEAGESEDEEDVFEVESILDSKIEEGETLYRVRWKGYDSDGDTWEPEAHLDDCKEVLLEFKRKQAESKQKSAKKETPKLSLSDVYEADSDSEPQGARKDASPHKKKKKSRDEEDDDKDDLKTKKAKSGKSKERTKSESEPAENQSPEPKPKKRTSEGKEDLNNKKQKKEDSKESKKTKKEDNKDSKTKGKEEHKEKKHKKEKPIESEQPSQADEFSQDPVSENMSIDQAPDEKAKTSQGTEDKSREASPEKTSDLHGMEDESDDAKLKRKKKKKHKKIKTDRVDEVKSTPTEEVQLEKKSLPKKPKVFEKVKEPPAVEKLPAPIQKNSRPSTEEKTRRSLETSVEDKEARKPDTGKEKPKKKHDSEKDLKKEPKVVKNAKEPKSTASAFSISSEDVNEIMENSRKREDPSFDHRIAEEPKPKDLKPVFKERKSTRDESDTWSFVASEGDQEVMDPVCHLQENSAALESKSQCMGLGMDLQLEWMTLEDFQSHLDGSDEILPTETISNGALKDAVKNGDYLTVKFALNSTEEYNLDQEDSSGMTLVMMAAAAGQDDLLRLLIKKGAKINARQKNGTTALIHAAEKNHLTTVALLLEAGAYVNLQQNLGETALMKACRRGNYDIVRLLIEHGADCNVLSKHNNNALQFANQSNNVLLSDMLRNHMETLTRVVEDAIKDYFENRLALLDAVFPIACHRLCEGPDFSLDFHYKPPSKIPEGSGVLLFVFHANFFGKEVVVRLCGPCSVQAVVLNDKFQLPIFLDAHFIYSFSPINGQNKLFIRLSEVPTAKVKLLICAYRVQLQ